MEYSKIIEPYLIDFDKLKVSQTLWSVKNGDEKILKIDNFDEYSIYTNLCTYDKKGNYHKDDKYPTLFTFNPFANLQRVEPKLEKCTYCEHYGNLPCDKCEFGRSKIKTT